MPVTFTAPWKRIRTRLLAQFMVVALVPMGLLGGLAYRHSANVMRSATESHLKTVGDAKARRFESYLLDRRLDIEVTSQSPAVSRAIEVLSKAYKTDGPLSPEYLAADRAIRPYLTYVRDAYGFYDLFLISPEGDVVFSLVHEDGFGTNLNSGPYRDSQLAEAFKSASTLRLSNISEYRYYPPSKARAAFVTAPALAQESLNGVVAAQLDVRQINQLAADYSGLGATGETVFAQKRGEEIFFLTPPRHATNGGSDRIVRVGDPFALPMQRATAGSRGFGTELDYRGHSVLASWTYLSSMKWGMVIKIDEQEALAPLRDQLQAGIALGLSCLLLVLILAYSVSRSFSTPIASLSRSTQAISEGDLTVRVEVPTEDELGELAHHFNRMVEYLQVANEASNEADYIRSGLANLNIALSGALDLQIVAQRAISEMTTYVGADVGTLYIAKQRAPEAQPVLSYAAGYACARPPGSPDAFEFGEGLIGQAAAEKKQLIITEVPRGYVKIRSSMGETDPSVLILTPFLHEGEVLGVMELAAFEPLTVPQLSYLERVVPVVAINLFVSAHRHELSSALQDAQVLSEELQAQQEELRLTNDRLEEQTQRLGSSEEELRSTNEELLDKNNALSRRKAEVEQAQVALTERAHDLALASKYKSEFLSNMSHELRTPLNGLLILSQLLADNEESNLTAADVKSAEIIHESGKELQALIDDILDLSKVEAGKLIINIEDVDVLSIKQNIERKFSPVSNEHGLDFTVTIAPGLPLTFMTDTQRTQQILKNLLSNAFKFTSEGSVALRVEKPGPEVRFRTPELRYDNTIAFVVEDTGVGIPAEKQQEIFEAFRQADGGISRTFGGTGLGLTIGRELAKLMGGEIHLQSHENKGSTFSLYLPLDRQAGAYEAQLESDGTVPNIPKTQALETTAPLITRPPVTRPPSPIPANPGDDRDSITTQSRSLLIIEDDRVFSALVMRVAKRWHFQCITAATGMEGLKLAKTYRPTAIVLDLGLPDISGVEILKELRRDDATKKIPVHVITAADIESVAIPQGSTREILVKPVLAVQLEGMLGQIDEDDKRSLNEVLLVDSDLKARQATKRVLANDGVQITEADGGIEALQLLARHQYRCMIVADSVDDMTVVELLARVEADSNLQKCPTIVSSSRPLSHNEHSELNRYATSIVIQGDKHHRRITNDMSLFLHSVDLALPPALQDPLPLAHEQGASLKNKTILLVDDDPRNVYALSIILEQRGIEVLVADNGKVALEQLQAEERIDLVMMDIMMPIMDGYAAMQAIRKQRKYDDLPIIALTANAMAQDREKCLRYGANEYMSKPVDRDQLFSVLMVWLFRTND